ncbi:MAG: hypothetical protein Q7S52_05925 [bacterium]|nr:hypothetical protein [bacterium]
MSSITLIGELNSFALPIGVNPDELFDVYGSDAVLHDERDPQHNYWLQIDDVAEEDVHNIDFFDDEAYWEDLRTQLLGDDAEGDEPISKHARVRESPLTHDERQFLLYVFVDDDIESGVQYNRPGYDSVLPGLQFIKKNEMAYPRKEVIRRHRSKRETTVKVQGQLLPHHTRDYVNFRAGKAKPAMVHPGTLHLPHVEHA